MKKRFYDQEPSLSQAIELLLVFPAELQSVIADGLASIAEREFKANEMLEDLKSLGTDKVLAIYKSKQKKRKYDQNPAVHRAMNYLLILSPQNRLFICRKIIELMTYLQDYLRTCHSLSLSPTLTAMEGIRDAYIQFGPSDARRFLDAMEQEFRRKLRGMEHAPSPAADSPMRKKADKKTEDKLIIVEEPNKNGHSMKLRRDAP